MKENREKKTEHTLLSINEAMLLINENQIFKQIDIRKKLIGEMVGWLYPSILYGEIDKLYKRIKIIRYGEEEEA